MDDYSINSLIESQNEWCSRLVTILTPLIINGFKSIFNESLKLCNENNEQDKYLMTFQNFISRVPKWNQNIIKDETNRIKESSGCGYLEELVTCVHIIKLKALTCARVGQKQKKINIDIPPLENFIHKIYINVARKLYTNVYLFEHSNKPLQIQKHNREFEIIIKESILLTIRDSIPVEEILRAYLDETQETDVEVEEQVEVIEKEIEKEVEPEEKRMEGGANLESSLPMNHSSSESFDQKNNVPVPMYAPPPPPVMPSSDVTSASVSFSTPSDIKPVISDFKYDEDDDEERIRIGNEISLDDLDINDMSMNDEPKLEFELLG
jgi:hypothetical protein